MGSMLLIQPLGDTQGVERHLAAERRPLAREQTRLETDKAKGAIGPHAGPHDTTTVSVQPRGYVQGKHRHAGGVDGLHRVFPHPVQRSLHADAQQSVHNHIRASQSLGVERLLLAPRIAIGLRGPQGIAFQFVTATHVKHPATQPRLQNLLGQHIAVACVVAHSANHDDGIQLTPALTQPAESGLARAPHQPIAGYAQRFGGGLIQLAKLSRKKQFAA